MQTTNQNITSTPLVIDHPVECEAPNNQLAKETLIGSNIKYLVVGIFFWDCFY